MKYVYFNKKKGKYLQFNEKQPDLDKSSEWELVYEVKNTQMTNIHTK